MSLPKYIIAVAVAFIAYALYGSVEQNVEGRNVIITGASTGIGEETAYYYCKHHANVVVIARTESKLKKVVDKCKKLGAKSANYIAADFANTEPSFYQDLVRKSKVYFGGEIETLILNHIVTTGAYRKEGYYNYFNVQEARTLFDVNTFSYMAFTHAATLSLESAKGRIIVIGSAAGRIGLPSVAVYSASKASLFAFFDSLRQDYARSNSNISITTCTLGSIDTENARKNVDNLSVTWHSVQECARTIVQGGESRQREVFFPFMQTYPIMIIRLFPWLLDIIIQAFL